MCESGGFGRTCGGLLVVVVLLCFDSGGLGVSTGFGRAFFSGTSVFSRLLHLKGLLEGYLEALGEPKSSHTLKNAEAEVTVE